jgi:hypothetical protein
MPWQRQPEHSSGWSHLDRISLRIIAAYLFHHDTPSR